MCIFKPADSMHLRAGAHIIGISGPERSDERVEQGQVTMRVEALPPWWSEITGSGRSRP
jgi:hypothetical protein